MPALRELFPGSLLLRIVVRDEDCTKLPMAKGIMRIDSLLHYDMQVTLA